MPAVIEAQQRYRIRDVAPGDLDEVLRLNESVVPAVNSIDIRQMRWFASHAAYFRVAVRDSELGGFLIGLRPGTDYASPNYRWFCERYDDFGYIDRVAVAAEARRHGLATRLYRDFERSLPKSVGRLTCEVNIEPPNESSMRFHAGFGFRRIGSQLIDNGSKRVALLTREWDT